MLEKIRKIFFNNSSARITVAKNTLWLSIAEGTTRILKLVFFIFLARILGATEYGVFSYALALVSLFIIFADFGISSIATRELSKGKFSRDNHSSLFGLKIALGVITLALIIITSFIVSDDIHVRYTIWILGAFIVINYLNEILFAIWRAEQAMQYEAITKIVQSIIVTTGGIIILYLIPSTINVAYCYVAAALIALVILVIIYIRKFSKIKFSIDRSAWKEYVKLSWPLAFVAIFSSIYSYIDSVMMGYWGFLSETGYYNASYKIMNTLVVPSIVIAQAFYPAVSRAVSQKKKSMQRIWDSQIAIVSYISLPLTVFCIYLAPQIITLFYSSEYSPTIPVFKILMLTVTIIFITSPYNQALITSGRQKTYFYISMIGALANIVLNIFVIPKYNMIGASITTVITYLIIGILAMIYTKKHTKFQPLSKATLDNFSTISAAIIAMVFGLILLRDFLNPIVNIIIAIAIYIFLVYIILTRKKHKERQYAQKK